MRNNTWTILLLIALLCGQTALSERWTNAKGPLPITGQTPLQTLRLDLVPTRSEILGSGKWELTIFNSLTNRWNKGDNYLLDVEIMQNILGFSIGAGDRLELGLMVPVITRSGGKLDPLIMSFHDRLGLSQSERGDYPLNAMQVSFVNNSGEKVIILDKNDQGTVIGDISLLARSRVYQGGNWLRSVIWTTLLRLPTAEYREYYGSGGIDSAMSLSTSHRAGPLFIYTTLGYGIYGSGSLFDIDLRPYQWTFFASVEYPVSNSISVIAQQMSNSGVALDFDGFDEPTHELIIGIKHAVSRHLMFEYGVVENLYKFRNSVDFGLNVGLSYRY